MALTDTATLLTAIGLCTQSQRMVTRYDLLRQQVEAAVKSYCKWELEQASVIDFYDGNSAADIPLRRPWVSGVANVWFDPDGYYGSGTNSFASTTLLTSGADYALVVDGGSGLLRKLNHSVLLFPSDLIFYNRQTMSGLAWRSPAYWPDGYGNVKVEYTFGFLTGLTLSAASWSSGIATFTTSAAHSLLPGRSVTVGSVSPVAYNGVYLVRSVPSTTIFTASLVSNPGAYVSGGSVSSVPADIVLAVETGVSIAANSVKYGFPVQSEGLGAHNYSLAIQREPEFLSVRQLLARYRDLPV